MSRTRCGAGPSSSSVSPDVVTRCPHPSSSQPDRPPSATCSAATPALPWFWAPFPQRCTCDWRGARSSRCSPETPSCCRSASGCRPTAQIIRSTVGPAPSGSAHLRSRSVTGVSDCRGSSRSGRQPALSRTVGRSRTRRASWGAPAGRTPARTARSPSGRSTRPGPGGRRRSLSRCRAGTDPCRRRHPGRLLGRRMVVRSGRRSAADRGARGSPGRHDRCFSRTAPMRQSGRVDTAGERVLVGPFGAHRLQPAIGRRSCQARSTSGTPREWRWQLGSLPPPRWSHESVGRPDFVLSGSRRWTLTVRRFPHVDALAILGPLRRCLGPGPAGVEDEGLAALVNGEVAQTVGSGGELPPGATGQPHQRPGPQVDGVPLGREVATAGQDVDQDVEVGACVCVDGAARSEGDEVGVEIAFAGLELPDRASRVRLTGVGDCVGGVDQDAGKRGGGELW